MMRKTRKRNIKKRKTQKKRIFFGGTLKTFKLLILDSDQINSIYNNIDDDIKLYIRTLVDEKAQYYKIDKQKLSKVIDKQKLSKVKQKCTNTSLFKLILIKPMYN